jgi:8-oxo-dGTP pyrophosphatase MutT (NUDIX family)
VFRLAPMYTPENDLVIGQYSLGYGYQVSDLNIELDIAGMGGVEVALVGRSQAGIWALPKGTPLLGETIEQVAIREAQEETGLQVRLIAYIGSITYTFVRDQVRYHKQVRHFLLEAIGGDTALHDHEYDLVEWFSLAEATRRLTYPNEVNILYQAEEMLQRWLQYRYQEGLR